MKIVTVEEMRSLERACEAEGISTDTLMEKAGLAVAQAAWRLLPRGVPTSVVVLVGPGNNGGDGLVAARHLQSWGARVTAYLVAERKPPDPKLGLARDKGVRIISADKDTGLLALSEVLAEASLVIDAILGTGRARALEGTIKEALDRVALEKVKRPHLNILALDLPTGLDADTGQVDASTPRADVTVTLGYPKVGLYQFPGAAMVGRLEIVDIGIPAHLAEDIELELLTTAWLKDKLPTRPLDAHKGTFGRLLVVAGSRNYVGAAALAAEGAARAGAGLVAVAAPESIYPMLAAKLTEAIHLPLPDRGQGAIHPEAAQVLREQLPRFDALLIGCGLGASPWVREFLSALLFQEMEITVPVVLDADALNHLESMEGWWERLQGHVVLTPHPGEMSRLTGVPTDEIQARRIDTAREWSQRWQQVVLLKGAFTVIASPHGATMVSPFANPALASAGTGDVLAGMVSGFLAQGLSAFEAACCGVYLHGAAGERMREELGDAGVLARDLLPQIPRIMKEIKALNSVGRPI